MPTPPVPVVGDTIGPLVVTGHSGDPDNTYWLTCVPQATLTRPVVAAPRAWHVDHGPDVVAIYEFLPRLVDTYGALSVARMLLAGVEPADRATWLERLARTDPRPIDAGETVGDWTKPAFPPLELAAMVLAHRAAAFLSATEADCAYTDPGPCDCDAHVRVRALVPALRSSVAQVEEILERVAQCGRRCSEHHTFGPGCTLGPVTSGEMFERVTARDDEPVWSLRRILDAFDSDPDGHYGRESRKAAQMLRWHVEYAERDVVDAIPLEDPFAVDGPEPSLVERAVGGMVPADARVTAVELDVTHDDLTLHVPEIPTTLEPAEAEALAYDLLVAVRLHRSVQQ